MNTNISKVTLQKQYLSHTNLENIYTNLSINLPFSSFCSVCVCVFMTGLEPA